LAEVCALVLFYSFYKIAYIRLVLTDISLSTMTIISFERESATDDFTWHFIHLYCNHSPNVLVSTTELGGMLAVLALYLLQVDANLSYYRIVNK